MMPLTILSACGEHRAIVSETGDGSAVAFFKATYDRERRPSWRYLRTSTIPQPFHVALNLAHAILDAA